MNNNIRHKEVIHLELDKSPGQKKDLNKKPVSDEEKKLLDLISHIIFENIIK